MILKALLLSTALIFSMTSQASLSCPDLLSKTSTVGVQNVFTESELLGMEMLTSAILASTLGKKGYHGIERDSLITGTDALSPETRKLLVDQLHKDLVNILTRQKVRHVDVKHFIKKGLKSAKTHTTNVASLRALLAKPSALKELREFIEDDIDAIVANALIMPLENKIKSTLKRSMNRVNFLTAVTIGGGLVTWAVSSLMTPTGLDSVVPLFVLMSHKTWLATGTVSTVAGAGWALLRYPPHSPIFDLTEYNLDLGAGVRSAFAGDDPQ